MERAERADAIGNEVWTILGRHDTLTEPPVEKTKHEAGDLRLGPFGTNYFNKMKIPRRIKEMYAQEVLAKIFGPSFSQKMDGNAACI